MPSTPGTPVARLRAGVDAAGAKHMVYLAIFCVTVTIVVYLRLKFS
jgi:hypothetical protein